MRILVTVCLIATGGLAPAQVASPETPSSPGIDAELDQAIENVSTASAAALAAPESPEALRALGDARQILSVQHALRGERDEAVSEATRGVDDFRALVRLDPENPTRILQLAQAQEWLGNIAIENGITRALGAYEAAAAELEGLQGGSPGDEAIGPWLAALRENIDDVGALAASLEMTPRPAQRELSAQQMSP